MQTVDPLACAMFLIVAFVIVGVAQTAWFTTEWSRAMAFPVDGGLTLRGRRLFGDNKTLRGFVIMIPASAIAFVAVAVAGASGSPAAAGLWNLTPLGYAALGAWAGFGFMAGELPNSLLKRQLGIEPGRAVRGLAFVYQFIGDRLDSGIGMLTAVSLAVPTPWRVWAFVLVLGPAIHWAFSVVMFRLGIKPRAA
jgi:CDP-2,3-bis-(O-geranylgeranyl)-sn-glycerol synthase